MGSPVTFSGFTSIDWNSVLNAVMAQESQPVTVLQSQQSTLKSQQNAFSTLATKLTRARDGHEQAVEQHDWRRRSNRIQHRQQRRADFSRALGVRRHLRRRRQPAGARADHGQHEPAPRCRHDGGGHREDRSSSTARRSRSRCRRRLQKLADAINATEDIGVTATVVSPTPGQYQIVLDEPLHRSGQRLHDSEQSDGRRIAGHVCRHGWRRSERKLGR